MKVALVYDRLNKIGGAERVLSAFHELYPQADWYTSVWDKKQTPFTKDWNVQASWINKIPLFCRHHEWIPFLMPFIFESFDFRGYDLVISIGSAECKGIVTRPETIHVHYCLTPTRYLYSHAHEYLSRPYQRWIARYLRAWDMVASTRPDYMISISEQVKNRVKKYYKRDSEVIYPPVDIKMFSEFKQVQRNTGILGNYYLIVSRLVPYKRIDVAVEAFNANGNKLVVVGTGSEHRKLQKMANPNITFVGQVSEEDLVSYYQGCKAYIQCNEEDFGISMVEAQAAGKPVIAYNGGGAAEIVRPGTGVLYNEISVASLTHAIEQSMNTTFDSKRCRENAQRFDKVKWLEAMKERMNTVWQKKTNIYM